MGDGRSNSKDSTAASVSSSVENVQRKMILMQIAESEKSHFDDVLTCHETDNGWTPCHWKETENSVTQSDMELNTKRSVPSEWLDEQDAVTMAPVEWAGKNAEIAAPNSYYELMDLNEEPVESNVRLARVPSQYQLDALSEMFIFDVPQHYAIRKSTNCHIANITAVSMDQDRPIVDDGATPYYVNSEYASELLM
uniref:Uncharacterized protein n=1 Tax=Caenorhabditis japonica TaxID=281687 RepID=A0A8R1HU62_CAEJA